MRASIAIVLLAIPLLGLALLWMPDDQQQPQPLPRPHDAPAELQPAGQPAPAPQAVPEPAAEAVQEPSAEAPSAEPNPAVAPGLPPHPSSPEYAALLAARFDADPPDVDGALERDIARRIAAYMPSGSRIDSIECRQMLCRVRSLHPDRPAYEAYVAGAFNDPESERRFWKGQVWIAVPGEPKSQGARIESVVYLQRDPNPKPP